MRIASVSYHYKNPTERVLHHIVLEHDMFPVVIWLKIAHLVVLQNNILLTQ